MSVKLYLLKSNPNLILWFAFTQERPSTIWYCEVLVPPGKSSQTAPRVVAFAKKEYCPTPASELVPPSLLSLNSVGEAARAAGRLAGPKTPAVYSEEAIN